MFGWFTLDLPAGTRVVVEGALMAAILIIRPSGITGGREFSLPRPRRRDRGTPAPAAPSSPDAA